MHWNGLNNFGRRPHRHHIPVKFGQNPEEDVQVKMLTDDARRTTDKGLSQQLTPSILCSGEQKRLIHLTLNVQNLFIQKKYRLSSIIYIMYILPSLPGQRSEYMLVYSAFCLASTPFCIDKSNFLSSLSFAFYCISVHFMYAKCIQFIQI